MHVCGWVNIFRRWVLSYHLLLFLIFRLIFIATQLNLSYIEPYVSQHFKNKNSTVFNAMEKLVWRNYFKDETNRLRFLVKWNFCCWCKWTWTFLVKKINKYETKLNVNTFSFDFQDHMHAHRHRQTDYFSIETQTK